MTTTLSHRLAASAVIVVAAILGAGIATLLISPLDREFAAVLVGVIAVVRVTGDLAAWKRKHRNGDV